MSNSPAVTLDFSKAQKLSDATLDFSKAQKLEPDQSSTNNTTPKSFSQKLSDEFEATHHGMGDFATLPIAHQLVGEGYSDIMKGNYQQGAHKIISGALEFLKPAAPVAVAEAPIAAALSAGAGYAGSKIGEKYGPSAGLTPELGGDIGGLFGASIAPGTRALGRSQFANDVRGNIGASIHTPEGELTSGAKGIAQATGAAAGAAGGHLVGGPVGAAAGGAAGFSLGPTLMDKIFPESPQTIQARQDFLNAKTITEAQEAAIKENALKDARAARAEALARKQTIVSKQPVGPQLPPPELGSPENPGFHSQLPARLTQAQQDTLRTQAGLPLGRPSPFSMGQPLSSLASSPDDLISRTQRLTIPGETPTALDLKRAGDLTQAPLDRLKQLAKFGDRLAQNEINRRLKNP